MNKIFQRRRRMEMQLQKARQALSVHKYAEARQWLGYAINLAMECEVMWAMQKAKWKEESEGRQWNG